MRAAGGDHGKPVLQGTVVNRTRCERALAPGRCRRPCQHPDNLVAGGDKVIQGRDGNGGSPREQHTHPHSLGTRAADSYLARVDPYPHHRQLVCTAVCDGGSERCGQSTTVGARYPNDGAGMFGAVLTEVGGWPQYLG